MVPNNDTIARVRLRPRSPGPASLRDIFGWSRLFRETDVEPEILHLMRAGGILARRGFRWVSRLRVASLGERLFLHSAWPPKARDAVFFGPDSYRFAELIRRETPDAAPGRIIDIGAGAGVGGLVAADLFPGARVTLTDLNPLALRLARINAAHAAHPVETAEGDGLAGQEGPFDLALANPPFIIGAGGRAYRDGGGALGAEVSLAWTRAVLPRLAPGGRLILYTGAAIVDGRDPLREALETLAAQDGCALSYREIDPDLFGGLLLRPDYWTVERIAAVGAVVSRP